MVEDSADDAELVLAELRRAGLVPHTQRVETESDFLAELKKLPDIILSDFSLPQFSGWRALELLLASGLDIPFILISGTMGEETAVEAMKRGASDYLLKDRTARLGSAVHRALEQKKLRREHRQAAEALRASEERFRQIAENINEVFWITNPTGDEMIYVSPAYEAIWGRTCASLQQSPHDWLAAVHPDDRERIVQTETKRKQGEYNETYRILRPDGSLRWIHDRAFPVRNAAGEVYRIVGTAEDITENRKLEEQFRQSQKMEAIGQLAGGVAHDFNNMLAVIKMQAYLLKDVENLTAAQLEAATEIEEAAERATNLTRQLLLFSRRQAMQFRHHDLNEIIVNIHKMLRRVLGEDILMKFNYAAGPLFILADSGMVDQVLMNMAVNARDAMTDGGQLIITTAAINLDEAAAAQLPMSRHGSFVCLSISDNGCGIAPEIMPRIFEPFFTTKGVGQGTGLGLATVFGIVQQHRGWINIHSAVGQGTTFCIYFPREGKPAANLSARPIQSQAPGGNATILLVEDDDALRASVRKALERLGYCVIEADSGLDALEIWRQNRNAISLLITDMVMPGGLNGKELARRLVLENPKLKILYTSGYNTDLAQKNFHLEADLNFLAKPFDFGKLAQTVMDVLAQ